MAKYYNAVSVILQQQVLYSSGHWGFPKLDLINFKSFIHSFNILQSHDVHVIDIYPFLTTIHLYTSELIQFPF